MLKSVTKDHSDKSRISVYCSGNQLREHYFEDVKERTNYELFQRGLRKNPNGRCLGTRVGDAYSWKSYTEVHKLATNVGANLVRLGNFEGHDMSSMIGIYSKNRWEFDVTQLACYYYSLIPVPIYDTLGQEGCSFIVNQAEFRVVCVDGLKSADEYISIFTGSKVEHLIFFNHPSDADKLRLEEVGINVLLFQDFEQDPEQTVELNPASEEDLACILYTSGTTGMPKGVMLTHKAFACVIGSADLYLAKADKRLDPSDVCMSYLPSAHSFNSVVTYCLLSAGGSIGYYSGSVLKLMEDIAILKPTFFPIVPRLLNRIYDKITQGVRSAFCLKRFLFEKALEGKLKDMQEGVPVTKESILAEVVFKPARQAMGGRVGMMLIGSAPISEKVLNFARAVMGCEILECYGQTETCGGATSTFPFQYQAERVGVPLPCCECKLVDIPEMDYLACNGEGEVCFRGHNMFKGYFKDTEKTKEAIDDEGWVHTGDVGRWLDDGSLKIVDRKKHIFKLSQGEYIAPEKLESAYVQIPLISQMFLHGDSLESSTVAIIVPDEDILRSICQKKNIATSEDSMETICANEEVKSMIMDKIKEKAKEMKFNSLEVPKQIHVTSQVFTIENDLLTPTMKSKRPALRKHFADEIKQMYEAISRTAQQN